MVLWKEGNLRALHSMLQYILGPEWVAGCLITDLVGPLVSEKLIRKLLFVHLYKLQQCSATIQPSYICEKVFDVLKEAWSKFNQMSGDSDIDG